MTDGIPTCSRCRDPLSDDAFTLSPKQESPESAPRVLRLCPHCTESFQSWYGKRGSSLRTAAANLEPEDASASPTTSSSNQSKRRHRHKKEKHPVIWVLVVSSVTILLFLFAFYWTWTILKTATRTGE